MTVERGKIRALKPNYGFIAPERKDIPDLFFLPTSLVNTAFEDLAQDQMVEFQVESHPKGMRASNVRVL